MPARETLRLSPSALRSYTDCPYRYMCEYVIRVPDSQRAPVAMFAFGSAVHAALARFFRGGGHDRYSKSDLIQFLLDVWPSQVFPDEAAEFRNLERGRTMLDRFYEHPYPEPSARSLGIERRLSWKVPRGGIIVTGKLDRICEVAPTTLAVVDYKTGMPPNISDAILASDFQALFYRTLAAEHFGNYEEVLVAFHYLPTSETRTVRYELGEFRNHWQRVSDLAEEIRYARTFQDRGLQSWEGFPLKRGSQCGSCPMRNHCKQLEQASAAVEAQGRPAWVRNLVDGFAGYPQALGLDRDAPQ